jgi:hypothetical protein
MFSLCQSVAPRGVDRYPGSECAAVVVGINIMFSVCKRMVPHGIDRYTGLEWAGGGGGDQHYGTGMFSVCKSKVLPLRVDLYPGSENTGGGGGETL